MKFKRSVNSPDFIPLNPDSRFAERREKFGSRTMSVNGNPRVVRSGYTLDRALLPRIQRYLEENDKKKYFISDIEEMADALQKQYPEYGRKKKIPFRNSVRQAYEEIQASQEPISDGTSDLEVETSKLADTLESSAVLDKSVANDSLRSMYSTNRPKPNFDDIMIIDTNGDRPEELPLPQSTPAKRVKKIVKRKKPEIEGSETARKKVKSGEFQSFVPKIKFSEIGGNEKSLKEVRKLILHMKHPEVYKQIGLSPPRGFLLHGPPGCGKTLLALAIAGELEMPVYKVAAPELVSGISGESEEQIRHLFEQAVGTAPCIIFIDEIDAITPKRETAQRDMERRIVAQLLTCLDDLGSRTIGGPVLVIGATNYPDSLDPALRRAGRFDREISLGIPDIAAREQILQVVCKGLTLDENIDWKYLALNTPGYVGADLRALATEAGMIAVNRAFARVEAQYLSSVNILERPTETAEESSWLWLCQQPNLDAEQLKEALITLDDFRAALKIVQPSAQREGFATVPDVTWKDVGALTNVRQQLHLAILWPIRFEAQYEALGLTSPSGVLLCGPPGCGKTLLAKAIANEAGINFISVKGPELLNMYVGESERAVRQCFQRARNSVPCVIFFDELDALCPRRSDHHNEGGATRVVNQLLTEMDGMESRRGVFLMAATNRPDIVDPAVLRPGRLDKILYVGFPTAEDRVDILRALTKQGTKPKLVSDAILDDIGSDPRLEGYTGADLFSLVKEAATQALKEFVFDKKKNFDADAHVPNVDAHVPNVSIHLRHFQTAIDIIKPSVSIKDRKHYVDMSQRV